MLKRLLIFLGLSVLTVVIIGALTVNSIFRQLSQKLGVTPSYLYSQIQQTLNHPQYSDRLNFIILGLDYRDDSLEKTQTTDTIIFASYQLSQNRLSLVSLPRDIWDFELNKKINEIYPLSLTTNNKFDFIKKNYQRLIGQKVDHVIILNTSALSDLVKLVGGVDVQLNQGFTDYQYPNPAHILNPKNPKIPVYITVSYPSGINHLNSETVIPFVRSRKSLTGGTDLGRIDRQQLVIDALITKIKDTDINSLSHIASLYKFWKSDITTDFLDNDLAALALQQKQKLQNITLSKIELTVGVDEKSGQIYHPEKFINPQWVFLAHDKDYSSLHQYIQSRL